MNAEIPEFLIEMSQQMHQQSNRYTAEPIWQVRCKRYLVTADGYNESHWEIIEPDEGNMLYNSNECDKRNLIDWLIDNESEWCNSWLKEQYENDLCAYSDEFCEVFLQWFDVESDYDELPESLMKIHMQETEEVVKTCFTEVDALAFIARKQHDYPKLYTYVESMVFCPQMIQLRNWIMSLTGGK